MSFNLILWETLQFNELQEYYLQRRRTGAQARRQEERDIVAMNREGYHAGLQDFQSVLTTFTRYRCGYLLCRDNMLFVLFHSHWAQLVCCHVYFSRLRVIAELRHGDLFHSANIVSRCVLPLSQIYCCFGIQIKSQKVALRPAMRAPCLSKSIATFLHYKS